VYDLVCLDKKTGRILWIRSAPEFEGLSEEERKSDPVYADKLAPLFAELVKANAEAVVGLNAAMPAAMTTAPHALDPALKRKRDLEKQIQDAQIAIDKKKFAHDWRQVPSVDAGSGNVQTLWSPHGDTSLLTGTPLRVDRATLVSTFRHTITTRRIRFSVYAARLKSTLRDNGEYEWIDPSQLSSVPHPSYVAKALQSRACSGG